MYNGEIRKILDRKDITSERILHYASGGNNPRVFICSNFFIYFLDENNERLGSYSVIGSLYGMSPVVCMNYFAHINGDLKYKKVLTLTKLTCMIIKERK